MLIPVLASGRARFNPTRISGLLLWADPFYGRFQEITGPSATTPAAATNDPWGTWLARTGQYFTAAANGNRPLLSFGANGRPFALFDGVDDALTRTAGATLTYIEPATLLGNLKIDTSGGGDQTGLTGKVSGTGGLKYKPRSGGGGAPQAGIDQVANFSPQANTSLSNGVWARVGMSADTPVGAGKIIYRFNGAADGTATSSGTTQTGDPRIGLSQISNEALKSGLGDLVIYGRILTTAEYAALDAWMVSRTPT